ncbi:MAG TPA: hypothetical protein VE549_12640, partial [Myxococcaceae bacterium]|nr:hypothetical protein [Myxococcaceae bacterium]
MSSSSSDMRRAGGALLPCAIAAMVLAWGPFVACGPTDGEGDAGTLQRCEVRADCSGGQVCTQ